MPGDELEALQGRIEQLKAEVQAEAPEPQASPGLVFSLGFTALAGLWLGHQLGQWLSLRLGHPHWALLGWALGLVFSVLAVVKTLQPYLR